MMPTAMMLMTRDALVAELATADITDDATFRRLLVNARVFYGVSIPALAEYTRTSITTVDRWLAGTETPTTAVRRDLYDWLRQRAETAPPLTQTSIDPAVKARWCAALRSGQYQQTREQLCVRDPLTNDPSYCCLGVLCDLQRIPATTRSSLCGTYDVFVFGHDVDRVAQPPEGFMGLPAATIQLLARMNDSQMSFSDIAEWIEANL